MGLRSDLNAQLRFLMEKDDRVVLLGQSIRDPYGGSCKVTRGLCRKFDGRIFDLPISEAASVGMAVGMAMAGKVPILEIMFANFLTLCTDQIDKAASLVTSHNINFKLIIRAMWNDNVLYGPHHCGDMSWFTSLFNKRAEVLRLNADESDDIYKTAIEVPQPIVIVMEHKQSY